MSTKLYLGYQLLAEMGVKTFAIPANAEPIYLKLPNDPPSFIVLAAGGGTNAKCFLAPSQGQCCSLIVIDRCMDEEGSVHDTPTPFLWSGMAGGYSNQIPANDKNRFALFFYHGTESENHLTLLKTYN